MKTVNRVMMIILLLSSTIGIYATIEKNLVYNETDFSNDNWFTTLHDVVLNTTTNSLYLEGESLETNENIDCTTFTRVGTKTTVTASQIIHRYDSYNDEDYVYHDYGVDFFDVDKHLEMNYTLLNSDNIPYRWSNVLSLSNSVNGYYDAVGRSIVVVTHWGNVEYDVYLSVGEYQNGAWYNFQGTQTTTTLTRDTNYYCTFYVNDTHIVNDVYSDSDRTNRIRHLYKVKNDEQSYRYLYLARSASGLVGGDNTYPDVYSKDYRIRYYENGYCSQGLVYTKDLLENATDIAYMVNSNHTINSGTGLKIYVSPDNTTWTNIIDTTVTAKQYNRIEMLNYTSLYCKLELNSNGINNIYVNRFGYSYLGESTEVTIIEPTQGIKDLSNILIPIVIIALVIVLIAIIKR